MNDNGSIVGGSIEIDPAKLGLECRELLGELKALTRWTAAFAAKCLRSEVAHEQACLKEVVAALDADAERTTITLFKYAMERGAAQFHDGPAGGEHIVGKGEKQDTGRGLA